MAWRGYLAIILAAACWGISGTVAKLLFNTAVDPQRLVTIRLSLAGVILLAVLSVVAPALVRLPRSRLPGLLLLGCVGMSLVQFTYLLTISLSNVATAIFLQYLAPVMIAVYSTIWLRQPLRWAVVVALVCAIGGSFLLLAGGIQPSLIVLLSGLSAAITFTFYTLVSQKETRGLSPWTVLLWSLLFGAAVWNLITIPIGTWTQPYSLTSWELFLYIAIMGTLIPFGLYLFGLRLLSATAGSITAMLEPVVGAFAAFLLLGETMTLWQIGGAALVIVAVILVQQGERRPAESLAMPVRPENELL